MAKKTTAKKEKYITERISKAGTHSLQVCIRAYDQTFRKSILIDDFENRKQAMEYAKQLRDETLTKMRAGYTVSKFLTVEQIYQKTFDLLPVRLKTKKKHDTFYKQAISQYGGLDIDKVTTADIQISLNTYAKTHTKQQVIQLLAVWRRIYKCCAMLNINVFDRTVGVITPAGIMGNPRKKDISSEDLDTFCDALLSYNEASISGNYYCRAIYYGIQIMRFCGLRPAEAFALTRNDINMAAGYLDVNKAVRSSYDSIVEIGDTKTTKSRRRMPIPEALKPILKECFEWSRNEILLSDYYGNLLKIDEVDTLIGNVRKKLRTKEGINIEFTLYMLRHQFSTDLMSAGVTPNVIRDLMGHESATMTLDYATSKEDDRANAINNRQFS